MDKNNDNQSEKDVAFIRKCMLIDQVKNALRPYCDKERNEEVKIHCIQSPKHKNKRIHFLFDIYFPQGISELHIPEKSFLLIRRNIIADTIYRTNVILERWRERYPNSKAYLLYEENDPISDEVLKEAKNLKQTQVYQIDDFLAQKAKEEYVDDEETKAERETKGEGDWKKKRETILDVARYYINTYNCTLFLGAGVNKDAGGVLWDDLLSRVFRHFCKPLTKKDLSPIKKYYSDSPLILGRYILNNKGHKKLFSDYLRKYVLYKNISISTSKLIPAICDMVIKKEVESIITYNYDDIIENALNKNGHKAVSIYSKSRCTKGELPVYHVHGLIPKNKVAIQSTPVFSEEDYHDIYKEAYLWSNIEQLHALDRNTCFFIGLSMTDPNLRRLLDFSRHNSDKEVHHFVFMKRSNIFPPNNSQNKNDIHFRNIENQMESLGVNIIWCDDFSEIPLLLNKICSRLP